MIKALDWSESVHATVINMGVILDKALNFDETSVTLCLCSFHHIWMIVNHCSSASASLLRIIYKRSATLLTRSSERSRVAALLSLLHWLLLTLRLSIKVSCSYSELCIFKCLYILVNFGNCIQQAGLWGPLTKTWWCSLGLDWGQKQTEPLRLRLPNCGMPCHCIQDLWSLNLICTDLLLFSLTVTVVFHKGLIFFLIVLVKHFVILSWKVLYK